MKRLLIYILLICSFEHYVFPQSQKKFSAQEIKNDLVYMRNTLEASHYDFYALTDKKVFDSMYNQIEGSINDSLTTLQVFRLFQPYIVLSKMSHCYIDYPWNEYFGNYIQQGGTVFPLNLYFNHNKVFVRANFSGNNLIENNDEIISLNNKSIDDVMVDMYRYVPGPTDYYKNSQIEQNTFARLYWFFYGSCDKLQLKIKKRDGREITLMSDAIPGKEFEEKNKSQESLFRPYREFHIINDVAYLHPGGFINANSNFDMTDPNTFDNTEFRHFIDSTFTVFKETGAKNLIIDLRYNPGGSNSFSDYMIAYFASKPFPDSSKFSVKTSQITKKFWEKYNNPDNQELKEKILSYENGTIFEISFPGVKPHADSLKFNGNVYLIINRYSYSNAAAVAAIIQDGKFGKIIGEETAEIVSSYGATHKFKLPNTDWSVTYPKAFFPRPNGDTSQRGVIPDYEMEDNIFTDKDEVLEFTLKLIAKK
jgi:C-terminal processing protease CtpA/Prc